MSEFSILNLMLVNKALTSQELTSTEKTIVKAFIFDCMTDANLNKIVREKMLALETQAYAEGALMVLTCAYRTRHLAEFENFYLRAVSNYKKIRQNENLTDAEKLTVDEYAGLREIAALSQSFAKLESLDLISPSLQELQGKIKMSHRIVEFFEPDFDVSARAKLGLFVAKKEASFTELLAPYVRIGDSRIDPEAQPPKITPA